MAVSRAPTPVSNIKSLLHRLFLFALRFAISQAGIAPRTLTLMQGSKEKKNDAVQLQLIVRLA